VVTVDEERKVRVGVAMTGYLHREIKIAAAQQGMTVQEWAERALRSQLEREEATR
jgi:predicted HicB family RNase H-like nuclease